MSTKLQPGIDALCNADRICSAALEVNALSRNALCHTLLHIGRSIRRSGFDLHAGEHGVCNLKRVVRFGSYTTNDSLATMDALGALKRLRGAAVNVFAIESTKTSTAQDDVVEEIYNCVCRGDGGFA